MLTKPVNWTAICDSFCRLEGYTMYGCQRCSVPKVYLERLTSAVAASGADSEDIDWADLCAYLCSIGEGGAACNCDAVP
jgi:hypothetical protein